MHNSEQGGEEIVVVQSCGIIVQEEEHENRHEDWHVFHTRQGLLSGIHRGHVVFRVNHVNNGHQQAEDTDMVTQKTGDKWDISTP